MLWWIKPVKRFESTTFTARPGSWSMNWARQCLACLKWRRLAAWLTVSSEVVTRKITRAEYAVEHIQNAIKPRVIKEVGASVIEMAEAEYMVRASGYIQKCTKTIEMIPLGRQWKWYTTDDQRCGWSCIGPQMRRGLAGAKRRRRSGLVRSCHAFWWKCPQTFEGVKAKTGNT